MLAAWPKRRSKNASLLSLKGVTCQSMNFAWNGCSRDGIRGLLSRQSCIYVALCGLWSSSPILAAITGQPTDSVQPCIVLSRRRRLI